MLYIISIIHKDDVKNKKYNIKFSDVFKTKGGKNYKCLENALLNLVDKEITIEINKNSFQTFKLLEHVEFKTSEEFLRYAIVTPNLNLFNLIFNLKKCFTKMKMCILLKFKSFYSIRLYQLLKSYQVIKKRIITIDWLRDKFELKNKYVGMKNFKKRIIEESIKEINAFSDIEVSYKNIKNGRSIKSMEFTINSRKNNEK